MTVRQSSLCAQWVAKDPSFLHADSEDWSDWTDAQADLSLRWAHNDIVGFVMRRLIFQRNTEIADSCIPHVNFPVTDFLTSMTRIFHQMPDINWYILA